MNKFIFSFLILFLVFSVITYNFSQENEAVYDSKYVEKNIAKNNEMPVYEDVGKRNGASVVLDSEKIKSDSKSGVSLGVISDGDSLDGNSGGDSDEVRSSYDAPLGSARIAEGFGERDKLKYISENYENKLNSEEVDLEWSSETISSIQGYFSGPEGLEGVSVVGSNCASTICKVEVVFDSGSESLEDNIKALSMNKPWDGPTFFSSDGEGNVSLYFAREGHDLPDVDI